MFKIIAAHFRKVGRAFTQCFNEIAAGIETNDPDLKQIGFRRLRGLLLSRLVLWGIPGIYFAVKGGDLLEGYVEFIVIFYILAAIIAASTSVPEVPQQEAVAVPSDTVVMKRAIEGRDNLLDIILVVGESLARQLTGIYTIQCPKTKGQLAYPHINRCITVKDGVASIAVAFPYTGEADKGHFMEHFNIIMRQMLNAYELPGRPNPVFHDKDNVPHTSIQAIHADIVGDRIILEVIRVTQEAIPLLDELDRAEGDGTNDQESLYDDEL